MGRSCTTRPRHRARCGIGAIACFTFAAAYIAEAWRIIFTLRIGPVIAVVDEAHGHGIHSGDMMGVGCAIVAVMLVIGGAVLLDDAAGTAAHLAPVTVRSRSRHRQASRALPVLSTSARRRVRSGHAPSTSHTRRTRRARQAWVAPAAAA